jgi:hypothetical protein
VAYEQSRGAIRNCTFKTTPANKTTPRNRVFLEKLMATQLAEKFPRVSNLNVQYCDIVLFPQPVKSSCSFQT